MDPIIPHSSVSLIGLSQDAVETTVRAATFNGMKVSDVSVDAKRKASDVACEEPERKSIKTEEQQAPLDHQKVFNCFIDYDNRDAAIEEKIKKYTQELQKISSVSQELKNADEYRMCERLLSCLEKAKAYHNTMIGHLINTAKVEDPKKAASRDFMHRLAVSDLNSRPNKIERAIEHIEKNYEQLGVHKKRYAEVAEILRVLNNPDHPADLDEVRFVQRQKQYLAALIMGQQTLVDTYYDSIEYAVLPYQKLMTPELQAADAKEKKIASIAEEMVQSCAMFQEALDALMQEKWGKAKYFYDAGCAFNSIVLEAQKDLPQERVISWFRKAGMLSQQIAAVTSISEELEDRESYLECALVGFTQAALEAQKNKPQERVITCFSESADLALKGLAVFEKAGMNSQELEYYNRASDALMLAALEAQEPNPNERAISCYVDSAALYKEAIVLFNVRRNAHQVEFFSAAGDALYRAGLELQKNMQQDRVISWFTDAAALYKEIATAASLSEANYQHYIANALVKAASNAQGNNPKEEVISLYDEVAALYRRVIDAVKVGNSKEGDYLSLAGYAFWHAALEADSMVPREDAISLYKEVAALYQNILAAINRGETDKAAVLTQIVGFVWRAAEQAVEPEPDKALIEQLLEAANKLKAKG